MIISHTYDSLASGSDEVLPHPPQLTCCDEEAQSMLHRGGKNNLESLPCLRSSRGLSRDRKIVMPHPSCHIKCQPGLGLRKRITRLVLLLLMERPPQVLCWDCWDCWDCGSSSLGDGKTTTGLVFGLCVCTKSPPHDEELLVNGLADRKHNAHVVKRCR